MGSIKYASQLQKFSIRLLPSPPMKRAFTHWANLEAARDDSSMNSNLSLVFTTFPRRIQAIKLLAPLGNSDYAILFYLVSMIQKSRARPRAKWCYNERMKDAVVEAATLLDRDDASIPETWKASKL